MESGSHAKSTREVSRWRHDEVSRPKTKKVRWSSDVKDNRRKTPEPKSSATTSPKNRDSISSHSGGSYKSHRRPSSKSTSKLQTINETSEERFLTAEDWRPDVKDNHRKTPEPKSSAMTSLKKRDSISSHSGGSYKSHRRSSLESPSKLQKINETSEERFLTAEDVIKRALLELPTSAHVGPTNSNSLSSAKCSVILGKSHSPKRESPLAPDSWLSSSPDHHHASWRSESTGNEDAPPGFSAIKSVVEGKLASEGAEDNPRIQASFDGQDGRESKMIFSGKSCESGPALKLKQSPPKSTENEAPPPGFPIQKSFVEGKLTTEAAEDNPRRQVSSDGQESAMIVSGTSSESRPACALEHVPPGNAAKVSRKRKFQEKKLAEKEDLLSEMNTSQEDGDLDAELPKKIRGSCKTHESSSADALIPEKCDGPDRSTKLINNPSGIKFKVWSSSNFNDDQERNLQKNLPKPQEDSMNVPALKLIWMGNFDVRDKSNFIRYEGILAHPSAKVSRKAYDLSKQIPRAPLLFAIHPRHDFWPARFQTGFPGRNDIGLYFYPSQYEKSKRHYSTLLKLIEKNDLVLRSCMGNAQLLVYSSKLLEAESQTLDGNYFMWGVFCSPKVAFKGSSLPSTSVVDKGKSFKLEIQKRL